MVFRQWKKPLVPSEHGRITSVPPDMGLLCYFIGDKTSFATVSEAGSVSMRSPPTSLHLDSDCSSAFQHSSHNLQYLADSIGLSD
jgi:hypothetical protein